MKRIYNFSAGPAIMPEEVLQEIANEMLNFNQTGMSAMEISHRSILFDDIIIEAEKDLRLLMDIPNDYKVLFLQGGGSQQFAMIPMNLMKNKKASYIITGVWAKKAYEEACIFGDAQVVATSYDQNYTYIPDCSHLEIAKDSDYVYICENNTIVGTRFHQLPNTFGKPLVSDMSSFILSEPIDVRKYGLIFASAQKNVGPAGVTIIIVHESLVDDCFLPQTPIMLRYKVHVDSRSIYNTPPTYGIYICGKVFKWLLRQGGVAAIQKHNVEKAKLIYNYLDQSKLFKPLVRKQDRSLMNVTFATGDSELDKLFIKEAKEHNIVDIKGHRSLGGMRASMYNAMPKEGVEALVKYMALFESKYGV